MSEALDVSAPGAERAASLCGFTIVLTGERRATEFTAAFTRRGASVVHAPILSLVPVEHDEELHRTTADIVQNPPEDVIVTTAIGFRGWVEAADSMGLAHDLLAALEHSRILARGPKGRGAIRAAGLTEAWSAAGETLAEVVDHLLLEDLDGRSIVVQQHGLPDDEAIGRLVAAGARVRSVQVYRWAPSPDPAAVARALEALCSRTADAVLFTSAPGADAFLEVARAAGRFPELVAALACDVVAGAVGPVTAGPLIKAGVTPLVPDRYRLGALVRAVSDRLITRQVREVATVGGRLELRGQLALLDGRPLDLTAAPLSVLRALMTRPGEVLDRASLLTRLPGAGDAHAVEVAVARLRTGLQVPSVVQTVTKRGYRLATTPP